MQCKGWRIMRFPEFLASLLGWMLWKSEVNKNVWFICVNLTPDDSPLLLHCLHLEVQSRQVKLRKWTLRSHIFALSLHILPLRQLLKYISQLLSLIKHKGVGISSYPKRETLVQPKRRLWWFEGQHHILWKATNTFVWNTAWSLLTTSLSSCALKDGLTKKGKPECKSLCLTFKSSEVLIQAIRGKQNCAGSAS